MKYKLIVLVVLAVSAAAPAAFAGEPAAEQFRGDWVPASAKCNSPLRFRVGSLQVTLINGTDSMSYGNLGWPTTFFGPDYAGIVVTAMPEIDSGDSPFTIFFNADERRGVTKLSILQGEESKAPGMARYNKIVRTAQALNKRFPLDNVPLKRCAPTRQPA